MTQAEVRRMFVQHNPGIRLAGRKGYWYRCAHCGKWCGRPGGEKACIPDDMKMEVDHIKPVSRGGNVSALWNLQALCKPCNRSKSNNMAGKDVVRTTFNNIVHPVDSLVKQPVRKAFRQSKTLRKLGLNKRR